MSPATFVRQTANGNDRCVFVSLCKPYEPVSTAPSVPRGRSAEAAASSSSSSNHGAAPSPAGPGARMSVDREASAGGWPTQDYSLIERVRWGGVVE